MMQKEYFLQKKVFYQNISEDRKRKFRVKIGGNKNIKYTEGWVEFKDKKVARMVALSLNNSKMSRNNNLNFIFQLIRKKAFILKMFGV